MSHQTSNKPISIEDLKANKAFCVLPWLHLHVMPDSSVIPCCVSPYDDHYGNVSTASISEIWNNDRFKDLRRKMLKGELPQGCKRCHDLEQSGFASMRTSLNRRFQGEMSSIANNTTSEGTYHEIKLKYIDIRFSNLCNFKCRGCSPALSSSWYDDYAKYLNFTSDKPRVRSIATDSPHFWSDFQSLVMDAEEIYFGGGEPLITKEHFDLLRLLIDKNKIDVDLSYNTNLSTLTYGNYNLTDLWQKFRRVTLGISLDDLGPRAEYFRSGTRWNVLEANMRKLRDEFTGIHRYVNCTVNITNIFYLPDLFIYLTSESIIDPNSFNINLLLDPVELRIDVLPLEAKYVIAEKLEKFRGLLDKKGYKKASHDFKNIITHMLDKDNSALYPKFVENTKKLDSIRGESFPLTYPELANILGFK